MTGHGLSWLVTSLLSFLSMTHWQIDNPCHVTHYDGCHSCRPVRWPLSMLCSQMTAGKMTQSVDTLTDNILACVHKISKLIPGGASNLRSVHIKGQDTMAIPVFVCLGEYIKDWNTVVISVLVSWWIHQWLKYYGDISFYLMVGADFINVWLIFGIQPNRLGIQQQLESLLS